MFHLFKSAIDIHEGLQQFERDAEAMLLDVRTKAEYATGHIPGSFNLPLQEIAQAANCVPSKDTTLYVYCLSGGRSRQAVSALRQMGYSNVHDIGGIRSYRGKLEV